jgi:hypothetical protein
LDKWQFLSLVHFSAVKEKDVIRKEDKTELIPFDQQQLISLYVLLPISGTL